MLFSALQKVFQKPGYILLVGVVASAYLFFFLRFAINPDNFSVAYIILVAILTGVNISFITYYMRVQQEINKVGMAAGSLGIISGTLGVGCTACGSIIISSLIGTAAGGSLISFLPLNGGELRIVGMILLVAATYLLARQITRPAVC